MARWLSWRSSAARPARLARPWRMSLRLRPSSLSWRGVWRAAGVLAARRGMARGQRPGAAWLVASVLGVA
jgi:hypothetical protein